MKKIIYILFACAFASCSKAAPESACTASGNPILFSISDQIQVKSSVESLADLVYNSTSNPDAHVYIWATKENSDLKKEVSPATTPVTYEYNYCNKEILYNGTTGLWNMSTGTTTWDANDSTTYTYNFSAYAVRGTDVSVVSNTTSSNFGKSFTVELPEDYSKDCGTDFLLSNITSVKTTWNGTAARGGVVNLHMEHALASIRVKVKASANIFKVGIQGIQIKDFYRGATMQCTSQASYGSGKTNAWSRSNPTYNTTNYIIGDVTKGSANTYDTIEKCAAGGTKVVINKTDASHEVNLMDFIAIPQDPSTAVLTIAYLVQEIDGASEHQVVSSWNLSNYSNWEYGYRNVYTITIDTANNLYATVDDWNTGNSVTGVILP